VYATQRDGPQNKFHSKKEVVVINGHIVYIFLDFFILSQGDIDILNGGLESIQAAAAMKLFRKRNID
jgi:hypothetical protein